MTATSTDIAVEVAYRLVLTPEGPLSAAATPRGLCALRFGAIDIPAEGGGGPPVHGILDDLQAQLQSYFAGACGDFTVPIDLRATSAFCRSVLSETAKIPSGTVRTYGQIAAAVGRPGAARAVGRALHANPVAIVIPCHRVVGAQGSLTGYGGGLDRKARLLRLEGVRLPG